MTTAVSSIPNTGRRKLALVIGIGAYENLDELRNPQNDADDMSKVLGDIGFTVELVLHPTQKKMSAAVVNFKKSIQPNDIVVFYFAGHGSQWNVRIWVFL
ncbi:unnamed protein product [Rotaria sp. Silwood2]|nr:unnamed protein product [Rotaria sp. Silwood2]CAF3468274.1 unnamed protein product [Rotaria sp. Silwood2]CAF4538060.1 unnamed protein product [Rotaria sp. Silwood2]